MYEWSSLVFVAGALYLFECMAWIQPGATVVFRRALNGAWCIARGKALPGNERGGIAFLDPLGFRGSLVVCQSWPFSVSADGVTNLAPASQTVNEPEFIRFDEIRTVEDQLGDIRINGERFVRLKSSAIAEHFAHQIRRVLAKSEHERVSEITDIVQASFDNASARLAWMQYQSLARRLSILCASVFVYTFGLLPAVFFLVGLSRSWLWMLVGLLVLTVTTASVFLRLHSQLFPRQRFDRWAQALSMILLPPASARSADKLSRDVLGCYGAAVVGPLVCGRDTSLPTLRDDWFDLAALVRRVDDPSLAQPAEQCAAFFRGIVMAQMARALKEGQLDVHVPPLPESDDMDSYCPRCHGQFGPGPQVNCPDCPETLLVSFSSTGDRARRAGRS